MLRVPLQNQCHVTPSKASSETTLGVIRKTFDIRVSSGGKKWVVRRSLEDFRFLDRQLHLCVYDRKFSDLSEIPDQENINSFNASSNQVRNPLLDLATLSLKFIIMHKFRGTQSFLHILTVFRTFGNDQPVVGDEYLTFLVFLLLLVFVSSYCFSCY